jgi:chitinase
MTRTLRSWCSAGRIWMLIMLVGSSVVVSAQGLRTRDRTPPTAPTNLVVTAATSHSVSLAWNPSTDNSGSFSYVICCAERTVTVSQTVTSHTLDGLDAGATYTLRVYAKDAAGNLSRSSNPVTVTLPGDLAAPTKPEVNVRDVGPTHVTLAWLSTDDGPFIWYSIFLDGKAIATLNSTSATFAPLEQETTYTFTVQARDVDGNLSPVSDPAVVTTEPPNPNDHTPPTPPTNVTAERNGLVLVRWDPSTDDFTPQSLIRYDVYVNGVLNAVVAGKTMAEVDADPGVNTITVIAVDEADNESLQGTVTIIL